ncbi:M14 family metallopeptidase [Pseudoneobacillus sp. C159]
MKKYISLFIVGYFMLTNQTFANVVNPEQTYTYERMKDDIWQLKEKYDDDLSVKTLGYSHFGRKIYGVKLGNGEKNILMIGSHHGREWLTSSLLMEMLETYADAYHKKEDIGPFSSSLLDEVSIWFVPMLNPDGVTIQQGGIKKFPKYHRDNLVEMNLNSSDFSRWKANGKGIDLNRQYPVGWGELDDENVDVPAYQFYKGKKPVVAHETKAIVRFTKKIKPEMAVSYHTAGREIYWNYKNGKHTQRDRQIAEKAALLTGYKLETPPKESIGAGYTDWFISTFHRPALTMEISYLVGETSPPLSVFEEEWQRNKFVGMMLVKEAKTISNSN